MQSLIAVLLLSLFSLLSMDRQDRNNIQKMVLGNWRFESGKYIYFDDANKKLKERRITELEQLSVEVKPQTARVMYPDRSEFIGNYSVSETNGKRILTVNLNEKAIQYQITSISKTSITLQARHKIRFLIDGHKNKMASYSLVIIRLKKI